MNKLSTNGNYNQSMQHQNTTNNTGNNTSNNNNNNNQNNKGPTKDTWISPFENRQQNIDFFMYAYKRLRYNIICNYGGDAISH